jgi:hypothetical protein
LANALNATDTDVALKLTHDALAALGAAGENLTMVNGRLLLIRLAGQNPAPQMEFRYRTGLGQANLTRTTS